MHSRIFQISKNGPIDEAEFIEESRYYDHFIGHIADYVDEIKNPENDYKWLGSLPGITVNPKAKQLTIVNKKEYFKNQYERFKTVINDLSQMTEDEFASEEKDFEMYRLAQAYEDTSSFYVDDDDERFGIITLDDLVRRSKEGATYHLGIAFDYHF